MFEEVEYEVSVRFEPLTDTRTLKDAELQSGDIIVYQKAPTPHPHAATTTAQPTGAEWDAATPMAVDAAPDGSMAPHVRPPLATHEPLREVRDLRAISR